MKRTLLLIISFWILICCDINDQKLLLINDSNDTIYYRLLTHTKIYSKLYLYKLNPHDSIMPNFVIGTGKGNWENKINKHSIDSALYIFVFKTGNLNDSIIHNGLYIKYGFKVKKLEMLGWVVRFPDDFNYIQRLN